MSKEADQVLELYNKQVLSVKLINKVKDWLNEEIKTNNKYTFDDYESENVDEFDIHLFRGRAEVASGLLEQITKWEKS